MKTFLVLTIFFIFCCWTTVYAVRSPISDTCICPRIYSPICASNRKTYANSCLMKCESNHLIARGLQPLTILSFSSCEEDPVIGAISRIVKEQRFNHRYTNQNNLDI
ncbi:hypothetical protein ABEB36_008280 [Hypothenemus hampei]|uniref:Kazal-like domain-containing protein n=1 Tax=Hypothenemus hampei TaxID=57062 RepID=A0ABD1ELB4_HYPHA